MRMIFENQSNVRFFGKLELKLVKKLKKNRSIKEVFFVFSCNIAESLWI